MSVTFDEIGRRVTDMGMKFGVHAHLGSNFQTQRDVDAIMERTNPHWVYFVLNTGHITMAGIDPVALTRKYVSASSNITEGCRKGESWWLQRSRPEARHLQHH